MSNAAKELYYRQEAACYLYNRYFVVTDNKDITQVRSGTEVVSIINLMSEIAEAYKKFNGKQLYVAEIPSYGIHPNFYNSNNRQKIVLTIDATRDIGVKEVTERYLLFIANHTTIKEPELEFVMNFIKDHRKV